jgi:PEP-CTERM motif
MDVNGFTRRPGRAWILGWGVLTLLAAGSIGPRPAEAAARKLKLNPAETKTFVAWSHYLATGPHTWSTTHAPAFSTAIRSTIWQIVKTDTQSQQLENPMIDYLLWRQSLNPKRFAANHPNLSPRLSQLLNAPTLPTGVPPPTYTPVPQSTVSSQTLTGPSDPSSAPLVPPAGQTVSPPAVPEPTSLILGVGMLGWGLWWRRRMAQAGHR